MTPIRPPPPRQATARRNDEQPDASASGDHPTPDSGAGHLRSMGKAQRLHVGGVGAGPGPWAAGGRLGDGGPAGPRKLQRQTGGSVATTGVRAPRKALDRRRQAPGHPGLKPTRGPGTSVQPGGAPTPAAFAIGRQQTSDHLEPRDCAIAHLARPGVDALRPGLWPRWQTES